MEVRHTNHEGVEEAVDLGEQESHCLRRAPGSTLMASRLILHPEVKKGQSAFREVRERARLSSRQDTLGTGGQGG